MEPGKAMAPNFRDDEFPFDTYREYVSALSRTDNAYENLRNFFSSSPDDLFGSQVHAETQVPRSGAVILLDSTASGKLDIDRYAIGEKGSSEQVKNCIANLKTPFKRLQARIIFVSYHRDPFTGEYTGINTDIVDAIGRKFHIHPETLLWHFGSDFGLDRRFFPFAAPPIPSALSSRNACHLRHHDSIFSYCSQTSQDMSGTTTVDTGMYGLAIPSVVRSSPVDSRVSHHICAQFGISELGSAHFSTQIPGLHIASSHRTRRSSFTLEFRSVHTSN